MKPLPALLRWSRGMCRVLSRTKESVPCVHLKAHILGFQLGRGAPRKGADLATGCRGASRQRQMGRDGLFLCD